MDKITLPAKMRSTTGKGAVKKLRNDGLLPAVLYGGKGQKAIALTVNEHDIRDLLKGDAGANALITIQVSNGGGGNKKEHLALIHEIQKHPFKNIIWHLDFLKVSLDEVVKVEVPILFEGEAKTGVILETHLRKVEVECLPDHIPDSFTIDISDLEAGTQFNVSDLSLRKGVKILDDETKNILNVIDKAAKISEEIEAEAKAEAETETAVETESSQDQE